MANFSTDVSLNLYQSPLPPSLKPKKKHMNYLIRIYLLPNVFDKGIIVTGIGLATVDNNSDQFVRHL